MAIKREQFGRDLRALLVRRRLSYRDVQRLTGISFSQVGDLCAGIVRTRTQIQKLIAGLGLDPCEWMLKAGFVPESLSGDALVAALLQFGEVGVVRPATLQRPQYDRVGAGAGVLPTEAPVGTTEDAIAPYDYTVRVHGDSMAGVLEDGDIAFVKVQDHAQPGQLVIALVGDEVVVKRLQRCNGMLVLQSTNHNYDAVPASQARILGVVTGVYRHP